MSFHATAKSAVANGSEEMDIEPPSTRSEDIGSTLTNFASSEPLRFTAPKKLHDLRAILLAHGATSEVATLLDSIEVQFIPVSRENVRLMYACKDCGKMHDSDHQCGTAKTNAWRRALLRTGWEAAVNSWSRRGWRLVFDDDSLDPKCIYRRNDIDAESRRDKFRIQKRELKLVNPSDSSPQDIYSPHEDHGSDDFMPIWTKASPNNGREVSQINSRIHESYSALRAARKEAKKIKRVLRAADQATRAVDLQEGKARFLELHNQLHDSTEQMKAIDVERKFRRNIVALRSEIESLESRQRVHALTKQFGSINVEQIPAPSTTLT